MDSVEQQIQAAERDGIRSAVEIARRHAVMWRIDAQAATDPFLKAAFENKALAGDFIAETIGNWAAAHWTFPNSAERVSAIRLSQETAKRD